MPAITTATSALVQLGENWPMSFSSVHYLLFLPLVVGVYFLLRGTARHIWLLAASYWFYFFAAPRYLPVLLCGTLVTWLCGLLIDAGATDKARSHRLWFAVVVLVLGLCFFKYNGFFATFLAPLFAAAGVEYPRDYFIASSALGISFYTFTALSYLIDLAHREVPVQKNLLRFALFLGFFPSVSMGPISRAGQLMPQLEDTSRHFDTNDAAQALRTVAIGLFKKLAVADTLAVFTAQIYGDIAAYKGFTLTLAAIAFAVQLYFDFSGYTDIALGSAGLLGIKLPENFKNPYYSTNFSAFWGRWHISLSSFLQDYVFTPVVWSRWTEKLPIVGKRVQKPPVLSAIAATFLISGLWHGDTLPFLVWGALMAVFRIGEELLHRKLGKPQKNPSAAVRFGKTAVVLALWVESLVFFKVGMTAGGTVGDAFSALWRQFLPVSPVTVAGNVLTAVKNGFYGDNLIATAFLLFSLFCTILALWADWQQAHRLRGGSLATALGSLRAGPRWAFYFVLTLCCFAGFLAISGGFDGASFLYGGF